MPVYFAQAGEDGPVKIGRAINPLARLAILQTGRHERLRLLRTIDGGAPTEAWLHQRFSGCRLGGEWFRMDPAKLSIQPPEEVAAIPASAPGVAAPSEIMRLAGEAGLTLKEVCKRAGIAPSTFSRWRAGKTAPSIGVYQRISDALPR